MSANSIYNDVSDLLVSKDGFSNQNNVLTKEIDVDGESQMILFRFKEDRLTLMNISKNEKLLEQSIKGYDQKDHEPMVLEAYHRIKEKLDHIENKPNFNHNEKLDYNTEKNQEKNEVKVSLVGMYDKVTGNDKSQDSTEKRALRETLTFTKFDGMKAGAYIFADQAMPGGSATAVKTAVKAIEVAQLSKTVGTAVMSEKVENTEKNTKAITVEVRKILKIEGKIGTDVAKTANGLNLARGDYIKLIHDHKQKDGFFSTLELPKGTELKIAGHTTKKKESYVTCTVNNKSFDIKARELHAEYGKQYMNQYNNRPDVKKEVDLAITRKDGDKGITMEQVQKMAQKHKDSMPSNTPTKGKTLKQKTI